MTRRFKREKSNIGDSDGYYYHEARINDFIEEPEKINEAEEDELRSNRNSKFRPDCWEEENVPDHLDIGGSLKLRIKRGSYYPRGRGGRGGGSPSPCLWETSYYTGPN